MLVTDDISNAQSPKNACVTSNAIFIYFIFDKEPKFDWI